MLIAKILIGGALVLLIHVASMSKNYFLSGLIPLFPSFAIIAFLSVGQARTTGDLKETILFGMLSLLPYFVYLISMYFSVDHFSMGGAILTSCLAWAFTAGVLVHAWNAEWRLVEKPLVSETKKEAYSEKMLFVKLSVVPHPIINE